MHGASHRLHRRGFQTLVHTLFPPECLSCRTELASDDGLCGTCWRDTSFIGGAVCDACGVPMQGDVREGDRCDACLRTARPWSKGRSALLYEGRGRAMVLMLKHRDRHDIARPAARWMARAAQGLVGPQALVVPVPLHWTRLAKRRYNQSALLAKALGQDLGLPCGMDVLKRSKATQVLDGKSREDRFAALCGAITVNPRRKAQIAGRRVLLVDDVMTSGATLAACTEACLASRASEVCVVTLARVAKDT